MVSFHHLLLGAALLALCAVPPFPPSRPSPQDDARGVRVHAEGAFEGFTLISPLNSRFVYLVDMEGEVAHRWETDCPPSGAVYLLDSGHLLRCGRQPDVPRFHGGGLGGRLQEIAWDGRVVWEHVLADDRRTHHHDVAPLPDGNVLAIVWEHHSREQAIARGRDPRMLDEQGLWPDVVVELRPIRPRGAEVVWEWSAWDHLVQDRDPRLEGYGSIPDLPGRIDIDADHRGLPPLTPQERRRREELERQMRALGYAAGGGDDEVPSRPMRAPDWLHVNSVDHLAEHDLVVLSVAPMNELWVIDHSTTRAEAAGDSGGRWGRGGELLWRWGNPRTWGAGQDSDRRLFYQHDATWIPGEAPGELRLLYFNNGGERPEGPHSSVEEIVLPFDPERGFLREPGRPFGPEELAWSYADPPWMFSGFISGAQRLPNGNTLVCEGDDGRVIEVTPDGRVVWELLNPFGGEQGEGDVRGDAPAKALFRATRIAPDHPGLSGRGL